MKSDGPSRRILAITDNHALVIGLTFLGRPWEVTAHLDPEDSHATHADVLVVDRGTTRAAINALARFIERPAAIVIGTDPVDLPPSDVFIPRPFTLDELAAAIDAATAEPSGGAQPEQAAAEFAIPPSRTTGQAPRSPTLDPGLRVRSQQAGFWVVPGWALEDVTIDQDQDQDQDQDRTRPVATFPGETSGAAGPAPADVTDDAPTTPEARSRPGSWDADPASDVIDLAALEREGYAPDDTRVVRRGRRPRDPRPGELRLGPIERLRAMATRTRDTVAPDPELGRDEALRRFAQGVTAGGELETLLADMPILRSVRSLGAVIVGEVHAEFEADTTAYWQRFDDGFRVHASQGLTKVEQRLVVALDQPMLGEIHATGGGLLIDPVDVVQAAVAGIGGVHTESFMAAAIALGEGRYGILAVGRNRPLVPQDLDRLIAIATEAAPGIAIAQLLRRVTSQVVLPGVHREQDVFADERTRQESRFGHADT